MEDIEILRKDIDKIDDKIVDLLNMRAKLVVEIGNIKKKMNIKVLNPQREKQILERVKENSILLKSTSIEAIWKEILHACRLIQS
ncbi:MAG: chorismate mutase [Candidatus Hermodarchaeota archaeon]